MIKRNTVKDYLFQIYNWELKKKNHKKRKELKIISNKNTIWDRLFHKIQIYTPKF